MGSEFRSDTRGLANGLIAFFAIIAISGLLYLLLNSAMIELFDMTQSQAQTSQGKEQIDLAKQIWDRLLYLVLLLSLMYLLARAVLESKTPG